MNCIKCNSPIANNEKFVLNLKANKRIVNGINYDDTYTTQYGIIIEPAHPNQMVMMNTVTYNMYSCNKIN